MDYPPPQIGCLLFWIDFSTTIMTKRKKSFLFTVVWQLLLLRNKTLSNLVFAITGYLKLLMNPRHKYVTLVASLLKVKNLANP